MPEGRQFVVEILDAQTGQVQTIAVSGMRVVGSKVTGITIGAAASLVTWAGNGQAATAGQALTVPPAVRVVDANGYGVAGSTVTWLPGGGSGVTSTGNTSTTNANGVATVGSMTMGTASGSTYSLLAYSGNLTNSPIGFTWIPVAATSAFSIGISGGDSQSTTPAGTYPSRLTVLVNDVNANAFEGAGVTWTSTDAGGSFSASVSTTDASGLADVVYTAGTSAGTAGVFAAISSASSVEFVQTIVAGRANAVNLDPSTDGQTALSNTTLPIAIAGTIDDGYGNPISSGETMQFVVVAGSGNVSRATQTPVSSAWSVEWKTGAGTGQNKLEISILGVSNSTVTATCSATNPEADTILIESGNSQTGTVNAALALPLAVAATASGTSSEGQLISFSATSGSLSTSLTVSSATGVARTVLTLPTLVSVVTVTASAGTLTGSPLYFTATATADSVSSLTFSTRPSTQADIGVAWASQPVVISTDVYGNVVSTSTRARATLISGTGPLGSAISTYAIGSGVTATFSGLSLGGTGAHVVGFDAPSLSTCTALVTVAPPVPTQLAFTAQPSAVVVGNTINPAIVVAVQDVLGQTVTTATDSVTIALTTPGGATLSGTLTQDAVSGFATFSGIAVDTVGTYTLTATAQGLTNAVSASFSVTAASGAWPHEPGYTLLAAHTGTTAPTLNVETNLDTAGTWIKWGGVCSHVLDSQRGTVAPVSSPDILQLQYTANQKLGTASVNMAAWSDASPGSDAVANHAKSQVYFGLWFNAIGDGSTFEMVVNPIKPFGYWSYGVGASADNQGYWTFAPEPALPLGLVTQLRLQFRQQGNVARAVPGTTVIDVNRWYLLEFICGVNSAAGVADGTLEQWIMPYGGTSTRFCNRTDMVWKTTGATVGFWRWKLNNVYGGVGANSKTRTDYVLLDDFRITGEA